MADEIDGMNVELHLLILRGGVEPEMWGPYSSDAKRREDAREYATEHDSVVLIDAAGPFEVETLSLSEYA
ncbi:MAG: hypothetical protein OXH41_07650 [Chloroflexi bacterium]|nr:hypothetical protein [Chloroflexota bacterium]